MSVPVSWSRCFRAGAARIYLFLHDLVSFLPGGTCHDTAIGTTMFAWWDVYDMALAAHIISKTASISVR